MKETAWRKRWHASREGDRFVLRRGANRWASREKTCVAELVVATAEEDTKAGGSEQAESVFQARCKYAEEVEMWTKRIVLGLRLCPWAITSTRRGLVKYVTCEGATSDDVLQLLLKEAQSLCSSDAAPLSTTLIVCPYVAAWKNFGIFHTWHTQSETVLRASEETRHVSMVHFHPEFMIWRALAKGVGVGSVVQSHYIQGEVLDTMRKSLEAVPATIVEVEPPEVGARVLTLELPNREIQNVPLEFCVSEMGPPLLDNCMHRAPYPTVQLIRDIDLDEEKGRIEKHVAVKLRSRNAKLLRELGWSAVCDLF